ncbi:hypothetical protein ACE6H2_017882 [Prunus campanulata]
MANQKGEIHLDMENSEEKPATASVQRSISIRVVQHWKKKSDKWTKLRNIVVHEQNHAQPKRFFPEWNTVFLVSCVLAVSLDPLFLYIPVINEDMKCLKYDKRLKAISFGLRLLADLFYMADVVYRILTRPKAKEAVPLKASNSMNSRRTWQFYILLDILAVLPVPQVVLSIFLSKMRGSKSLKTMKFLNSLALLQYVPRVLPIYLLCHEREKTHKKAGIWVKSFLNFFLYILASHVIGALWYIFAIQREIACWQYACQSENGCEPNSFRCDDTSVRNVTVLNELCPINPPNATLFNFGIFVDALQYSVIQSTNFSDRFLNCFWWGLRHLSSFGQNLQTSTYAWENLFAVFISIIGLLLFLYLIGNLQVPKLKDIEGLEELKGICEHFKPVIYAKDSFIIREGEPLDMILLVTQGTVRSYTTSNGGKKDPTTPKHIKQGDFYGEELISWASKFPPSTELPISDKNVRSITRVEGFALTAEDLKNHVVLRYFWWQFTKGIDLNNLTDSQMLQLKELAVINSQRSFRSRKKAEKPAALPTKTRSVSVVPILGEQRSIQQRIIQHWRNALVPFSKSPIEDEGRSITNTDKTPDQPKPFLQEWWNTIFVVSCVLAVLLDPLFFYIPIVKEDRKCLKLDKRLKAISFALRSLTDLFYIADLMHRILARPKAWATKAEEVVPLKISKSMSMNVLEKAKRILQSYILLDILAVLPVPQVIGALWYFFAIQRETVCWQYACRSEKGCEPKTFSCDDPSPRNIQVLNDLCPIKPSNATFFDFGIFKDAVQSGVLQSTDFPEKFLYCFWWGLLNLSSFGQNLETSTYAWENLFAVFISIIGLLLFLYLIGNLQVPKLKEIEGLDELKEICEHFKPVIYVKDSFIIREGWPLDMILLITQGNVLTYATSSGWKKDPSPPKSIKKGDFYGRELITWASKFPPSTELPVSDKNVRAITRVEAFYLTAEDLRTHVVLRYFWWQFTKSIDLKDLTVSQMQQLTEFAVKAFRRTIKRRSTQPPQG